MSAIEKLIRYTEGSGLTRDKERATDARAELAQLREKADECDKWRAWKPDDETLADMQQQAKARDGSYSNGLAACSVYIGGLEAKLRELRAAAAELQRIKELVDPLEGQSVYDAVDCLMSDDSSHELYRIEIAELKRTVAEQAAQLEQALNTIKVAREFLGYDADEYGLECNHDTGLCVCALRAAIDLCDDWLAAHAPAPEHDSGKRLETQLRLCGISGFEREYRFDPVRLWRFDFAWPEQMVAVEVEGGVWVYGRHTRGSGFINDLAKYNAATLQGWRVLRYSSLMIETGEAVTQIETALGLVREAHDDMPF